MNKEVVANLAAYSHDLDQGIIQKDIIFTQHMVKHAMCAPCRRQFLDHLANGSSALRISRTFGYRA